MDSFDLTPKRPNPARTIWNLLTVTMLVGVLCLAGIFATIFINPNVVFNPFPPPAELEPLLFPTPTWTPILLPATWTPSPTIEPTEPPTKAPTWTPVPTNTLFFIASPTSRFTPTRTRTPTRTPVPTGMPFSYTITYMESAYYHPEAGCNWMGVAGQVVDKNNSPILYITIMLGGRLDAKYFDPPIPSLSGTSPNYGQSGFEFVIEDHPVASNDTMWIQLMDQANLPLTEKIYFDTYSDCTKNLIMFRFKKTR
ncbi:MAG: hypothetical protein FJZ96_05740 [Chloroflexi bacterium]|nr:hypothetical protein [Chloroflexota bacterium]